jgi:hypothetical protein
MNGKGTASAVRQGLQPIPASATEVRTLRHHENRSRSALLSSLRARFFHSYMTLRVTAVT